MNLQTIIDLPKRAIDWLRVYRWRIKLRDCQFFVPKWYMEQCPSLASTEVDALVHYLTMGWREGRNPGPEFDGAYYLSRYPDVAEQGVPPLVHYWLAGRGEFRHPNPSMDLEWPATAKRPALVSPGVYAATATAPIEGEPLISVIIPTYNREQLLPGVLDSWREVDRVTKIPYEILFSDDGSEDGTLALLESTRDLPIRVLRNKHGGASSARNAAIREARGRRVLIMGDDIFPDPELINVHWEAGQACGPLVATLGVVDWHPAMEVNHLMHHITEVGNEQFSYNRLADGKFVDFRHFYTCNICVDRGLLQSQKTLFDHRFDQYGFEDIELGYRLALQGMRLLFTRQARGDHLHPYAVDGFCRRQTSAGKMAVVFRSIHPGVGALLGVDVPERVLLKGGLPSAEQEALWRDRLAKLVERSQDYELLFERVGHPARVLLGVYLSKLYAPLFRAMYEYGVLQRLASTDGVLSLAMSRHFGRGWEQYWRQVNEGAPDLSQITSAVLSKALEGRELGVEIVDPVAAAISLELRMISDAESPSMSPGVVWRHRVSMGLHYLLHDPRQLPPLVKKVLRRYQLRTRAKLLTPSPADCEEVELSSTIALVVEPNSDYTDLIARFRRAFGDKLRVFEKIDATIVHEVSTTTGTTAQPLPVQAMPCGVLYWPRAGSLLPEADSLIDAWLAVVENNVDMAVISHGYGDPSQIRGDGLREHIMFSRRIAPAVFADTLVGQGFSGKVIRVEDSSNSSHTEAVPLGLWLGVPVDVDAVGRFSSKSALASISHFLPPEFPARPKVRPVVIVFPIFVAVGGVERNTVEILRQLNSQYDFVVLTMERLRLEQGSLGGQFREAGARLIQMSELTSHANYLRVLSHIKCWLKPDLVWICNGSPWLADNAIKLRLLFGDVPIVDQQVYDVEHGWINRYNEAGIRSFDRFIAVNQKIRKKFVGDMSRDPSRVDLIYSAVDTDRIASSKRRVLSRAETLKKYGLPDGKRLFGFIGRLTAQKRPLDFLRLASSRREHKDELFVMVGDGELARDAEAFISEHKLEVVRIPYVANTLELDSVLDGLIFTSAYEGLPIAMIEAMSQGVPILATDVGDIESVLARFDGGVVYPVNASAAEVFDAFETWLLQHGRFRESLQANAKDLLDQFSSGRIARQYVECFDKALAAYHDAQRT